MSKHKRHEATVTPSADLRSAGSLEGAPIPTSAAAVWNNIARLWFVHTDAGPVLADPQPAPPTLSVRL